MRARTGRPRTNRRTKRRSEPGPSALRVYGHTLGCRLNSYETEALLSRFTHDCGAEVASRPEEADVVLVNTCAVTTRAQARSRKYVRSAARRLDALVVATGCVAEISPSDFEGRNVLVVPNRSKENLIGVVAEALGMHTREPEPTRPGTIFPGSAPVRGRRSRAFLKIQDGCDNRCSYCVVPLARGPSRSQPREVVIEQAAALRDDGGYREIVLTGVDLTSYGRDLYGDGYGLPELARDLLRLGGFRLRISSLEPIGLREDTVKRLALPGVCRHFHLALQSGSDRILRRMGRRYTAADAERILRCYTESFPGVSIGMDVIVGFPGETEDDFGRTVELACNPAVGYLHVFPFSARPGTEAAELVDRMLPPSVITHRAAIMRSISGKARMRFRNRMMGTDSLILVEDRVYEEALVGLTDNYIPLKAPPGSREGQIRPVRINRENVCWGLR
ncbi:MiaB/RimO family radical SAM methylthiotransferase [Candidatus Fermentibacteria bacterium]|nr:MiaB/RimO family radical SAM methylthiotransferase [Candidatus Fermentibacteria bacterium]